MINRNSGEHRELRVTRRPQPDLADAVEAFALAELVLDLLGALFGLLQAAHGVGGLAVPEADVAQVEVGPEHVLPQLVLPLENTEIKRRQKDPFLSICGICDFSFNAV